ncbi:MAG: hypothetical protein CVU39_25130 [Chloroflexi bacterium HGW-Chloroflexi-10]|nr:MAG: hypothetical protein CVU39_25130 [Chloroflexi bacterium HGW-Chloroflexi-10]
MNQASVLSSATSILNSLATFHTIRLFIKMVKNTQWLYNDVQENRKVLSSNDSQLARRNYLRSLYSFYEVYLSDLREVVAKLLVDDFDLSGEWKLHEVFPLLDESARLGKNGKLDLEPNRIPFLSLVAYTLKAFAKQVGFEKEVLSDSRWEAFCQSTQIRHRITHPKFHTEIEITDDELKTIDSGLEWWKEINSELQNKRYAKSVGG